MTSKKSFTSGRTTKGSPPDEEWLASATISEFADRAAEAALSRLVDRLTRIYDDLAFGEVHWAGDRWRIEIDHLRSKAAGEAMVGWRGRAFVWVFDSEGGYRNLDELSNGDPSRMATIGLFEAIKEWRAQAEVVEREKMMSTRSIRERVKTTFRVEARKRDLEKLVNDRKAFDQLAAELASERDWINNYVQDVSWKRLISETWEELRENNWRKITSSDGREGHLRRYADDDPLFDATKALFRRRLDAIQDPSGLGTIKRYDIVDDQPGKVGIHVLGHRKAGDFWIMVEEAGEDTIEVYAYGETGKVYTSFLEGEEAAEEILRETEDLLDRNRVYLS